MSLRHSRAIVVVVVLGIVLLLTGSAAALTVDLPPLREGLLHVEFFDVAGIAMAGQTLGIDFVFENAPVPMLTRSTVWAELILMDGPHSPPGPDGDYPYTPYVVFGPGTAAYVLDADGTLLQTPVYSWDIGDWTTAPAPTLGVILTPAGWAGGDMMAYLPDGGAIAGVHYDLVLPSNGHTLHSGRIGVMLTQVPEPSTLLLLAGGVAMGAMGRRRTKTRMPR